MAGSTRRRCGTVVTDLDMLQFRFAENQNDPNKGQSECITRTSNLKARTTRPSRCWEWCTRRCHER